MLLKVKKLNDTALLKKSSQSYEASLAMWDHTKLAYLPPDTSELAPPNPSQTSYYSTYSAPEGRKAELT